MGTTRRHRKRPSGDLTVIELPDLLQSMGQSGRSGVLRIASGKERAYLFLKGGSVVGLTIKPGILIQALRWLGIATPEALVKAGFPNAQQMADHHLAKALMDKSIVPVDGIRDAIDISIEEGITELLGWSNVEFELTAEVDNDPWAALQIELGTSLPPSGLLMEGLRRQDELKRVIDLLPGRWDVLVRSPGQIDEARLDASAVALLGAWREGRPAGAVLQLSNLTPWQANVSCGSLIEHGIFRLAEGQELTVYADHARSAGHYRTAEGLYRRALERGAVAGRIYLALGELAERRNDEEQAAADYLKAAEGVADNNPADAVMAYRSSMRLGGSRELCLKGLLEIYDRLGETDDACDVLFELASFYEEAERLDEAMTAVREAQMHGADAIRCSQVVAALALMNDDAAEAVVHLEQVIRASEASGRTEELAAGRRQLLLLEPGRCELALRQAKALGSAGNRDEALKVLRRALDADNVQATEDLLIRLREYMGELDPADTSNHEALIKAYAKREDRAGASNHLLALANNQEREGDLPGLIDTLEQILELGGDQVDPLVRLARASHKAGRDRQSVDAWRRAVVAGLEAGDLDNARTWADEALTAYASSLELRELLAVVANRAADRAAAETAYRAAAQLALGSGELARARTLLQQAHSLQPEDLSLRLRLAELAFEVRDEHLDEDLANFIHFAVRDHNLGLALEWSRRRVAVAPKLAFAQRTELVELLRRMGRAQEELTTGRDLFTDMCEQGEDQSALELLQRLVASHSKNAELVLQLAELEEALGNLAEAGRFFRHAVVLFQQEERIKEAKAVLDHLEELVANDPEVARAREYLVAGQAINWAAIRQERAVASKQRLQDDTVTNASGVQRRVIRQGTGSFSRSTT